MDIKSVLSGAICAFVAAVMRKFPGVLLQWGDFAQAHAGPILDRYRDRLCTFNDDIQGTAAVTTGTLLAAVAAAGGRLCDQRVAVLGTGSAGCGIGEQLVEEDLAEQEARSRFFLIDRPGPLHDGLAAACPPEELERLVDSKMWQQRYLMVTLKRSGV